MALSRYNLILLLLFFVISTASAGRLNDKSLCLSQPAFICALRPTTGNKVRGTIIFTTAFNEVRRRRKCLLRVRAIVKNLSPGSHGFHVHTYGDATLNDASTAGGHFTDTMMNDLPHGFPDDRPRHWGDFGNLTANDKGIAFYDRVDPVARYRSVLGRSIVVHADPDMGSIAQPSGNSGPRQASCIIGFANPETLAGSSLLS